MSFFSVEYQKAKERFVAAGQAAGAKMDQLTLQALGPGGTSLTIDLATIGDPNAAKILLHTSGLHGVEGFAGSAIQLAALNGKMDRPSEVGVVFVHVLNPFGMAWLRRVNENNVDLNRNFLAANSTYSGSDPTYKKLDQFLNHPSSAHWFWPRILFNIGRFGFSSVKNAVAQGQYDFPSGLFFGGHSLQEGPQLYRSWLQKNIRSPRFLVALDVHTGLGRFGEEVLFCYTNHRVPDIGKKPAAVSDPVGYTILGGLQTLTGELFSQAKWVHFTEEFGTYSMTKILRVHTRGKSLFCNPTGNC